MLVLQTLRTAMLRFFRLRTSYLSSWPRYLLGTEAHFQCLRDFMYPKCFACLTFNLKCFTCPNFKTSLTQKIEDWTSSFIGVPICFEVIVVKLLKWSKGNYSCQKIHSQCRKRLESTSASRFSIPDSIFKYFARQRLDNF